MHRRNADSISLEMRNKTMRRKISSVLTLCLAFALLMVNITGCGKKQEPKEGETALWYINAEETDVAKEAYTLKGDTTDAQIKNALKALKKEPNTIEYKSAFQNHIAVEHFEVRDGKINLHMNEAFKKQNKTFRLLFEACVVQTLTQVEEIGYVQFFVGKEPIKNEKGVPEGYLCSADFVQNAGSSLHSYQSADLRLYYANAKGDKLKEEMVNVKYDSNTSLEKVIVEQLVDGPDENSLYPVLSPDTEILGVSTKDGICYVNLDRACQSTKYKIDPKITIYAIVNSITANEAAGKVQILIEGKANVRYQNSVNLSKPFSSDPSIVEE